MLYLGHTRRYQSLVEMAPLWLPHHVSGKHSYNALGWPTAYDRHLADLLQARLSAQFISQKIKIVLCLVHPLDVYPHTAHVQFV